MPPDRIPDPRDKLEDLDLEDLLSDLHPNSLAAFETWCRQVSARSALDYIRRYRTDIRAQIRRKEVDDS